MNQLNTQQRARILAALVEGNSIRATCRLTGHAKGTVLRFLELQGRACATYHDEHVRDLRCERIEADEIWTYVHTKAQNLSPSDRGRLDRGSVWTWVAIDPDTKLVVSYLVADRSMVAAKLFMSDLANRIISRPQVSTDSLAHYRDAVDLAFGSDVDYGQIEKRYERPEGGTRPVCVGIGRCVVAGYPREERISTSMIERWNGTLRLRQRRFTRRSNGFSRKFENLRHAVAIHNFHYNFCAIHSTLRVTPAMEARLTQNVWEPQDLVRLLPDSRANRAG